jgi:septal ring factor EnvC (AmiA/AmiB activator)
VNHSFPIEKLEDLLGKGMRKRDICRELGFPPSTVSKYILQLSTTRLIQESGNETSSNYQEKDPDIEGYREEISQLKENLGKEIQEKSRLQSQIMDLSKELAVHENMVRTLSETLAATPKEEGVLRSRIEISEYEGYYDNQRKIITETIKEEIYHVAQGRRIILESRATSGNGRRIIVDISGEVK